jgi:hypothetical protein
VVTVDIGPVDTLLPFTEGLVERRGEDLDAGLARLLGARRREPQSPGLPSASTPTAHGWRP